MVLYLKNKFISLGEGSFVVNEEGQKLFEITGKMFSPTKKKFIKDMQGNQLYMVRNKFWHFWTKKALIYDDGGKVCKVKEKWFSPAVKIVDCEDELVMQSNGLFKGFSILKNGEVIGQWSFGVQNASDIFRDSYRITVNNPEDAPLLVALAVAIDNIQDKRRRK